MCVCETSKKAHPCAPSFGLPACKSRCVCVCVCHGEHTSFAEAAHAHEHLALHAVQDAMRRRERQAVARRQHQICVTPLRQSVCGTRACRICEAARESENVRNFPT